MTSLLYSLMYLTLLYITDFSWPIFILVLAYMVQKVFSMCSQNSFFITIIHSVLRGNLSDAFL